ncbi:MAG: hypothetical protein ABW032_09160 [Burkholderiaceae bacterium]
MNRHPTAAPSPGADPQADGRDGRVVGDGDDNVLESIGKAIVAPMEGADEDAEPVDGEHGRAYVDLTRSRPQGQDPAGAPTAPKPKGKAL